MSKLIDLVGQKFGMLLVVKRYPSKRKGSGVLWETVCDCGQTKIIRAQCLRRGTGLHCHLHPRKGWGEARKVLTGQKFARLTVLSFSHTKPRFGSVWNCRCDCGAIKKVMATYLVHGQAKSCGCLKKEVMKRGNLKHGHAKGNDLTPEYRLWIAAKGRAKEEGLPFDITPDDIVMPEICPLLGTILKVGKGVGTRNSPSLDKIIPRKGYTKDNVWVVSRRANTIKNDATPEELRMIADNLEKKLKGKLCI